MLFSQIFFAVLAFIGFAAAQQTGVGNNYYYMGCYGYGLQADSSVVTTPYSYGGSSAGQISTLQQAASVCSSYYAWIVGDGYYLYCLKNRSLFNGTGSMNPACRNACPGNNAAMCGGSYGSGMFSLFEQA